MYLPIGACDGWAVFSPIASDPSANPYEGQFHNGCSGFGRLLLPDGVIIKGVLRVGFLLSILASSHYYFVLLCRQSLNNYPGVFHDDVVHGPARTVQVDGSYEDSTWEQGINTGNIIDASRAADRADKGMMLAFVVHIAL